MCAQGHAWADIDPGADAVSKRGSRVGRSCRAGRDSEALSRGALCRGRGGMARPRPGDEKWRTQSGSARATLGWAFGLTLVAMPTAHGTDHVAAALFAAPAGGDAGLHHLVDIG